jgi:alpha-L-rhamnosidase
MGTGERVDMKLADTAYGQRSDTLRIVDLRTEGEVAPIGIDAVRPRLGWRVETNARGWTQSAYRIQVALNEAALLDGVELIADSGERESHQSALVECPPFPLASRTRYVWRVQLRDGAGELSPWSAPASFETGLLDPSEWTARWIGRREERDPQEPGPSPLFRRTFSVGEGLVRARAYVTAQGLYALRVNGAAASDALFGPGWTSYHKRLQVETIDLTRLLVPGENVVGVLLGDGWFRGLLWPGRANRYGEDLAFLCQIELLYADGRRETIGTQRDTWSCGTGGILRSELYRGEVQDKRLEQHGWDRPGFDAGAWEAALEVAPRNARLIARACPPVRRVATRRPIAIWRHASGEVIADMGQNMVGWVRLTLNGEAGQTVTLRHAEALGPDGALYTENLQAAVQTDSVTLAGGGEEHFEPHFTYHGFRYVGITGYPGELTADAIEGVVLHSDLEMTGEFACSNPLVDQLHNNILWSQRGNFFDIPTDCPQRAERMGWTADVQLFAPTAAFNMDVRRFLTKWLGDLREDQFDNGAVPWIIPYIEGQSGTAGWGDAATIVPWLVYVQYGDRQALRDAWPSMKRWLLYVEGRLDADGIWSRDFQFGDWLDYASVIQNYPFGATHPHLAATAYYAHSAWIAAQAGAVLEETEDAAYFADRFELARQAFNRRFVRDDGSIDQGNDQPASQAAYVLALDFDLLPDARRPAAAAILAGLVREAGLLTTGFLGTPRLLPVLSRFGFDAEAYRLLLRREMPSWLYPVEMGATTIWERWDGVLPDGSIRGDTDMNSLNHYLYGAVGIWLYETVAGLRREAGHAGWRHIHFAPRPGGDITRARARFLSPHGPVAIAWRLEDATFRCSVEVPPNSVATLELPDGVGQDIRENGQVLEHGGTGFGIVREGGRTRISLGSGQYNFEVAIDLR